jgi:hypothetical protein
VKRPVVLFSLVTAAIVAGAFYVFSPAAPEEGPKRAAAPEVIAPPPAPARVEPPPVLAAPTGRLTGRVHRRGAGVEHARVQVKGAQLSETVSKEGGRYELPLPPGDYLVWATVDRESSAVAGPVRVDGQSQVDLELLPSASLEGVVVDAQTREPIERASVASTAGATVTDHAGRFRFDVLPAGETWIEAAAKGHLKRVTWLTLSGARPHSGMVLQLDPSARIEGTVVRGGAPVAGAQIWGEAQVSERAGQVCGPVSSGLDGAFALDCADGPLQLAASAPSSGSRIEGPRIYGEAGKTRSGVRIELGEDLAVDGTVTAQDAPLAGAQVTLVDARSQRQVNGAVTGPGGRFHVPGVAVGSYLVQVSAGTLNAQVGPFEQTGEGVPWSVVVPKGGTLTGRVEPATAGVRVGWRSGDWAGAPATAYTDEKGKFRFDSVPAGVLLVEAESATGVASARAHAGEDVVLKLAAAQLKVTVVDEKNLPVTDYLLIVEPLSAGSTKRIPVLSSEGEFTGVIGTGKWRVTATAQGFSTSEPRDVDLSAPATIELALKSAEQLRAVVLDAATHIPISGAEVTFKAFVPGRWYAPARIIGPFSSDSRGEVRAAVPESSSVEVRLGSRQLSLPLAKVPRDNGGRLELVLPADNGAPPVAMKPPEVQEYEGIGMQLAQDGPRVYVWQTFEGGPAEAAGILKGDTIVAVDGVPARAPAESVIPAIKGPSGTAVTLTLQREGETLDFVVRRRAIRY